MEYAIPGFIGKFCTPNALMTLAEYLQDYASEAVREKGWRVIERETEKFESAQKDEVRRRLERIKAGERDLHF